jgi:acetylornithine deacetylase/succinyl-diaminopimelate desuccinylase-like protein
MRIDPKIYQRPAEILQHFIRFDTTNPPGNETPCARYINNLLGSAGIRSRNFAKTRLRQNVVARIQGAGKAPPFLMYGHMDVVTTADQEWNQQPFEGNIIDGFIWGRGALDMKSGLAMMLSALMRIKSEKLIPPGDIIFAAVCDEEAGGDFGAKFLVEEHASLFEGVHYAISEFGGFNLEIGGRKFYPIQVSEKQICWMKATLRGPAGHGSMVTRDSAMMKLASLINVLDKHPLPVHITPVAKDMFRRIASALPFPSSMFLRLLTIPSLANFVIKLLGERGTLFNPLLHNTVNPTIVRGGDKENVIPARVELGLDGRLLPGFTPQTMIDELHTLAGKDVELDVMRYDPGPAEPDLGLFGILAGILKEQDKKAVPIPMLLSAVTDARFFSQLGIQTYGFTPMQIPQDMSFTRVVHAANERIPMEALDFGANAIFKLLQRFDQA